MRIKLNPQEPLDFTPARLRLASANGWELVRRHVRW